MLRKRCFSLLGLAVLTLASPASAEGPVSLQDAVRMALTKNPDAQTARLDVDRAESLIHQARAASLPTLYANGSYTRLDDERRIGTNTVAARDQLAANLQLTVPLIVPQKWAQWTRAEATADATRASAESVRRTVAVTTAHAYLAIILARRTLEVSERARDAAKAHYEYAHTRFAGGVGNRLDEVRAAQEHASTEVQVQTARTGLVRAREALGVMVGSESGVDAVDAPPMADAPDMPAALAQAKNRADMRAQEQATVSAQRSANRNWADYSPYLVGSAQPFFQDPPTVSMPQFGWQAQLVLTIPLYDGGLRYAAADERKALLEKARVAQEAGLRQARSEVRVAFEAMQRADEGLVAARDAARLARESLELSNIAYRAGATTNIEVIDAERRARDAESAAAIAEHTAREARLDVLAASGRFP